MADDRPLPAQLAAGPSHGPSSLRTVPRAPVDHTERPPGRQALFALSTSIRRLPGVGPKRAALLARLGIRTVGDALRCPPIRYEERRLVALAAAAPGQAVTLGEDRPGMLAAISSAISSANVNIAQAEIRVTAERKGLNTFVLEVADLKQLQAAMQAIRKVTGVVAVERVRGGS